MTHRIPMLLAGLGALGACASVPEPKGEPAASAADHHQILVEQTNERLEIALSPGEASLPAKAREDVAVFASGYLRYGHGALVFSAPTAPSNASAASREARMALAEAGVPYASVAVSSYDSEGKADAPIVLSFTRFEAQAPECAPLWTQDLAHQSNNQAWASFGCATQANLAAMLDDPHDLLEPRAEDARDSDRRDAVMERYRQGQPTGAIRSNEEHAQVSTVGR